MNIREYSQRAQNSADKYWHYLDKHNKGRVLFEVKDFYLDKGESGHTLLFVTLTDANATRFPESLFFQIDNEDYYEKELNIVSISPDGLLLTVAPIDDLVDKLKSLISTPEKVKLASDLKFLVKRIGEWYKNHGSEITPPNVKSFIPPAPFQHDNDTFNGTKEQADAILTIFEHPFTYIWGAPGTGKTRFVLSHALMHCINYICINDDDKIIVTAPTNNAVDQTLFGVLDVLSKHGIKRNKVLRIGIPTPAFASIYPDVCEGANETKFIKKLKSEIKAIKDAISNKAIIEEKLYIIAQIEPLLIEYCGLLSFHNQIATEIKSIFIKKSELEYELLNLNNLKRQLNTKKEQYSSFSYIITHKFIPGRSKPYKEELYSLEKQIEDNHSDILKIEHSLNECSEKIQNLNAQQDTEKTANVKKNLLATMKRSSVDFSEYISSTINVADISVEKILQKYDTFRQRVKNTFLGTPYFETTKSDLEFLLSTKEKSLSQKSRHSTLESATIIAGTLDTIVAKYDLLNDTNKFKIKHIFIDEAAYAPIIKTIIAFAFNTPVTLLGDHMQLPPVCEMDKEEIISEPDVMFWSQSAIHCANVFTDSFESVFDDFQNCSAPRFDFMLNSDLNYTHRFGYNLASVLAEYVYTPHFRGNKEINTIIKVINAKHPQPQPPRNSIDEVLAIKEFLKTYLGSSIGILTPYSAQSDLLKKNIPEYAENIMTVHASQGKEYDTVILSVCDTTKPWFTNSKNKVSDGLKVINTAISRAKKELIIVCNEDVWHRQSGQLIAELIKIKEP